MMKLRPFILIIMFFVISCATVPPEQLVKQDLIDLPGMSKKQIYQKSLEWIASNFQSYKSVTEFTDPETGKIIGNIITTDTYLISTYYFKVRMTIDIKDGKSRLTLLPNEVTIDSPPGRGIYGGKEKDMAHKSLVSVRNSYTEFMKDGVKDSNW